MRIAQVAPLYESVPPKLYGGTERVVSYLTEELVRLGHDVTLYASGDSVTGARLRPMAPQALRLDPTSIDPFANHIYLAERVFQESDRFDIVHAHIDYIGFPLWRRMRTAHVTTLHGRLDIPNLTGVFREFCEEPVVSISDSQRGPLPGANWQATVHHGLPRDLYPPRFAPGEYLAFLGRISPEKRVDHAIRIARETGLLLKIAAKVDRVDREYFDAVIKPLLRGPGVEYIGEIGEREKPEFLGRALALLFPIDWPEPFGLVMIEAMACGTPVIATARGSVPEVVEPGVTGYIVSSTAEAVTAVAEAARLDRRRVRQVFEQRFTAERMAREYLETYERRIRASEAARAA
jgi:glycosyltransferase involved in cell wall biosynthesis